MWGGESRDAAIGEGLEIRMEISGLCFCVNESLDLDQCETDGQAVISPNRSVLPGMMINAKDDSFRPAWGLSLVS